jgi:hypothetical protein
LEIDARAKPVSGVTAVPAATFASPEAPSHERPSLVRIATDTHGTQWEIRHLSSRRCRAAAWIVAAWPLAPESGPGGRVTAGVGVGFGVEVGFGVLAGFFVASGVAVGGSVAWDAVASVGVADDGAMAISDAAGLEVAAAATLAGACGEPPNSQIPPTSTAMTATAATPIRRGHDRASPEGPAIARPPAPVAGMGRRGDGSFGMIGETIR